MLGSGESPFEKNTSFWVFMLVFGGVMYLGKVIMMICRCRCVYQCILNVLYLCKCTGIYRIFLKSFIFVELMCVAMIDSIHHAHPKTAKHRYFGFEHLFWGDRECPTPPHSRALARSEIGVEDELQPVIFMPNEKDEGKSTQGAETLSEVPEEHLGPFQICFV